MYEKKSFKIVLIGDINVGKTSIISKYLKQNNPSGPTIGTEFSKKYISKYNMTLQIWDCAGQEKFRALTKLYYRNADLCILVFDLSRPKTLDSIQNYWIYTYIENNPKNTKFILVGNKSDLDINIDYTYIWNLCKSYNMKYIECSVNTNTNIEEIFNTSSDFLNNIKTTQHDFHISSTVTLTDTNYRYNFFSYC